MDVPQLVNPCGCMQLSGFEFRDGDCAVCWKFVFNPSKPQRGRRISFSPVPIENREPVEVPESHGPGTYLKLLLTSLGIVMQGKCGCGKTLTSMDKNGPEWCRLNLSPLVAEISQNAREHGWVNALRSLDVTQDPPAALRIATAAISLTPILSAIGEAVTIACERAEAPQPEPKPPQPFVESLPICKVAPLRRWRIDSVKLPTSEAHFNASIIEWRGRTLLAYRKGWGSATIHIAELRDGQPVSDVAVNVPRGPGNAMACEDPRFFVNDGSLWLEVIGLDRRPGAEKANTNIQLVRLDSETLQPVESFFPKYEPRRDWEKNWGCFECH